MKKIVYMFIGIALILSGCVTSKEQVVVKEKKLPSWYLQPPKSSTKVLYSVGEGKDKQEALSNALSSLLATLSVSISSKYSAKTVVKEGSGKSYRDAKYENEIESEVKKIRISSYEVLKTEKLGFKKYALLIKVDKEKFFRSLQNEIDQEFSLITTGEKQKSHTNALELLAFYNQSIKHLGDLQNRLIVMSVLNVSFKPQIYLSKYEKLLSKRDKLLHSISFWVSANYKPLIAAITKGLSSKKIRIKKLKNKTHFDTKIVATMQRGDAYGFYIVRAQLDITTRDYKGSVIASNLLNLTGQSSQSYAIAKQDIAKKLSKLVDKEGIAKILNISSL